jgi:hypothetical protein
VIAAPQIADLSFSKYFQNYRYSHTPVIILTIRIYHLYE